MKKKLCIFLFVCSLSAINAEITNLNNYVQLSCAFAPAQTNEEKLNTSSEDLSEAPSTKPGQLISEGLSTNWSGYASATSLSSPQPGSVSQVSGLWTVPHLAPTPSNAFSSFWVGIDGYRSGTVEQIGTSSVWYQGQQYNYAWFEMYPLPPYQIYGFPVKSGDLLEGEVEYVGNNQFRLTLVNHSRFVYVVIPYAYTNSSLAERSSAEWIVEAPSMGTGILPLADFQLAGFTNCTTTIDNLSGGIRSANWQTDPMTMVTPSGAIKAIPSVLAPDEQSFYVLWEHE